MQLDCQKKILPKEEWTKFEDVSKFYYWFDNNVFISNRKYIFHIFLQDVLYLTPHVNEVKKEREEREKWELE